MVQLFRFRSDRFDPAAEEPNPINPIPGLALLRWLREALAASGREPGEPAPEDWGWYLLVEAGGSRHLIGASGEGRLDGGVDWVLQIHRQRTLRDRLRRAHRSGPDADLVASVESLLRLQADFSQLASERDA